MKHCAKAILAFHTTDNDGDAGIRDALELVGVPQLLQLLVLDKVAAHHPFSEHALMAQAAAKVLAWLEGRATHYNETMLSASSRPEESKAMRAAVRPLSTFSVQSLRASRLTHAQLRDIVRDYFTVLDHEILYKTDCDNADSFKIYKGEAGTERVWTCHGAAASETGGKKAYHHQLDEFHEGIFAVVSCGGSVVANAGPDVELEQREIWICGWVARLTYYAQAGRLVCCGGTYRLHGVVASEQALTVRVLEPRAELGVHKDLGHKLYDRLEVVFGGGIPREVVGTAKRHHILGPALAELFPLQVEHPVVESDLRKCGNKFRSDSYNPVGGGIVSSLQHKIGTLPLHAQIHTQSTCLLTSPYCLSTPLGS